MFLIYPICRNATQNDMWLESISKMVDLGNYPKAYSFWEKIHKGCLLLGLIHMEAQSMNSWEELGGYTYLLRMVSGVSGRTSMIFTLKILLFTALVSFWGL